MPSSSSSPSPLGALRDLQRIINDALDDLEKTYASSTPGPLPFPALDDPYDPESPGENLTTTDPEASRAISLIVAAASQLCASVQHPFLSICDAAMGYQLPACLRVLEASNAIDIMSQYGREGVGIDVLVENIRGGGLDKRRLAHIFRLLATHHIITELPPGNVFALNRISGCLVSSPRFPSPLELKDESIVPESEAASAPPKLQDAISLAMDCDVRASSHELQPPPQTPISDGIHTALSPPFSPPTHSPSDSRSSDTQSLSSPMSLSQTSSTIPSPVNSPTSAHSNVIRSPFHSPAQSYSPLKTPHHFNGHRHSFSPLSTPIRDIDLEGLLTTPPSSCDASPPVKRRPRRSTLSYTQISDEKEKSHHAKADSVDIRGVDHSSPKRRQDIPLTDLMGSPLPFSSLREKKLPEPIVTATTVTGSVAANMVPFPSSPSTASSATISGGDAEDGPDNSTIPPIGDRRNPDFTLLLRQRLLFHDSDEKGESVQGNSESSSYPSPPLTAIPHLPIAAAPQLSAPTGINAGSKPSSPASRPATSSSSRTEIPNQEHRPTTSSIPSKKTIKQWVKPEDKYTNTNGVAAFVGLCTDELFKSAAYLLESLLPIPQYHLNLDDVDKVEDSPPKYLRPLDRARKDVRALFPSPSPPISPLSPVFPDGVSSSRSDMRYNRLRSKSKPRLKTKQSSLSILRSPTYMALAPFNYAFNTHRGYFAWLEESSMLMDDGDDVSAIFARTCSPAENMISTRVNVDGREQQFRLARFGRAMTGSTSWEGCGGVWNALDWNAVLKDGSVLVDVGGGIGSTSVLLARGVSEKVKFVVQDRGPVVKMGEETMRNQCPDLLEGGNIVFQEHDFFKPQPALTRGAAVYLLRVVLHDWPDRDARRILRRLREAAVIDEGDKERETKLVIADYVLPLACVDNGSSRQTVNDPNYLNVGDGAHDGGNSAPLLANLGKANANAYWLDLTMQCMFNSQERTLSEMVELCASAGWKVVSVERGAGSLFGYVVAVPSPLTEELQGEVFSESEAPDSDEVPDLPLLSRDGEAKSSIGSDGITTLEHARRAKELAARKERERKEKDRFRLAPPPVPLRCSTPTFGSVGDLPTRLSSRYAGSYIRRQERGGALPRAPAARNIIRRTPTPAANSSKTPHSSKPSTPTPSRLLSSRPSLSSLTTPTPAHKHKAAPLLSPPPTILAPRRATLSNASLSMTVTSPATPRGAPAMSPATPTSSRRALISFSRRAPISAPLVPPPQRDLPSLPPDHLVPQSAAKPVKRDRRMTVSTLSSYSRPPVPSLPPLQSTPPQNSSPKTPTRDDAASPAPPKPPSTNTVSNIPVPSTPRRPATPHQRLRRATISSQSVTQPSSLPPPLPPPPKTPTSRPSALPVPSTPLASMIPVPSTPRRSRTPAPSQASTSTSKHSPIPALPSIPVPSTPRPAVTSSQSSTLSDVYLHSPMRLPSTPSNSKDGISPKTTPPLSVKKKSSNGNLMKMMATASSSVIKDVEGRKLPPSIAERTTEMEG